MGQFEQFEQVQLEVESLVRARGDLDAAEELIDSAPDLKQDERAALWLYAWALLPRGRALAEAQAHIRDLAALRG